MVNNYKYTRRLCLLGSAAEDQEFHFFIKAFPFIHEVYPAAWKKFRHWSGVKRSQMSPMASMS